MRLLGSKTVRYLWILLPLITQVCILETSIVQGKPLTTEMLLNVSECTAIAHSYYDEVNKTCVCEKDYPIYNGKEKKCVETCPSRLKRDEDRCKCEEEVEIWSSNDFKCIAQGTVKTGLVGNNIVNDQNTDKSDKVKKDIQLPEIPQTVSATTCKKAGYMKCAESIEKKLKKCCDSADCVDYESCSQELCCDGNHKSDDYTKSEPMEISTHEALGVGDEFVMLGKLIRNCEENFEWHCPATDANGNSLTRVNSLCCFDSTCDSGLDPCSPDYCCAPEAIYDR